MNVSYSSNTPTDTDESSQLAAALDELWRICPVCRGDKTVTRARAVEAGSRTGLQQLADGTYACPRCEGLGFSPFGCAGSKVIGLIESVERLAAEVATLNRQLGDRQR